MQPLASIHKELLNIQTRIGEVAADIATEQRRVEPPFEGYRNIPLNEDLCADLFKALANAERLRILGMLGEAECYFAQLLERSKMDNSPLRFHLTVLKDVNLITQERFRGKYMITQLGSQALGMAAYFNKEIYEKQGDAHEG